MEDKQRSNAFNLRSINQMMRQTPCASPFTCIQYDRSIHDFDISMLNVSIGLSQYLMVYRLIGNISISMTNNGYATIKKIKGTTR